MDILMQSGYDFEIVCKNALIKILKEEYNEDLTIEDLDFVWYNYTLQNYKAVLINNHAVNGRICECTYQKDTNRVYVDIYQKQSNTIIQGENFDHVAKPKQV